MLMIKILHVKHGSLWENATKNKDLHVGQIQTLKAAKYNHGSPPLAVELHQ